MDRSNASYPLHTCSHPSSGGRLSAAEPEAGVLSGSQATPASRTGNEGALGDPLQRMALGGALGDPLSGHRSAAPPIQRRWANADRQPVQVDQNDLNDDAIAALAGLVNGGALLTTLRDDVLQAGGDELVEEVQQHLRDAYTSDNPVSLAFLAGEVAWSLRSALQQLQDDDDDDEMTELGHDEDEGGDAAETPLERRHLDMAYWRENDPDFLFDVFCDLAVADQIREAYGNIVLAWTFRVWATAGVMTRLQIIGVARDLNVEYQNQRNQRNQQNDVVMDEEDRDQVMGNNDPIQQRRGAGVSGPKTFNTSTVGGYTSVSYTRNNDGYFSFGAPSASTTWTDPRSGGSVDLEAGCATAGYGVMKNNKTVVRLANASRSQHFSIANRITGRAGSGSPAGYTWHHLDTEYLMILVDRTVHRKYGHNGGVFLWN